MMSIEKMSNLQEAYKRPLLGTGPHNGKPIRGYLFFADPLRKIGRRSTE